MRSHFRTRRVSRCAFHRLLALGVAAAALTVSTPNAGAQVVPCANCGGGTLSGTVFNDVNGNQTQDLGDSPIPNALVRLIADRGQVVTTTTNALGQYTFGALPCGNYTVAEDVPTGWTQTTPNLGVGGVHLVFLGTQGDTFSGLDFGRIQQRCLGAGDFVDNLNTGFDEASATTLGGSGVSDDDWLHTATYPVSSPPQQPYCTDASGNASPGTQFLWLQPSAPAVTKTYSSWAGPQTDSQYVTGFPGSSTPNGDHFYQHCFCLAETFETPTLSYSLYADDYASVYLNGNLLYTSPTSGSFTGLPHPRSGGPQPLDPTPYFHPGFNCITVEVVNTAQVVTAFDLVGQLAAGNGRCCVAPGTPAGGTLTGAKWNDLNANGAHDPGEPGLAGWTLQLVDAAGNVFATAVTDANGHYTFPSVPPGTYTVVEVQQAGWSQTAPPGGSYTVTVDGQTIDGLSFGNFQKSCALLEKPKVSCGDQAPFTFGFDLTNLAPFGVTQLDFYDLNPPNFTITPDPMAVSPALPNGQTQSFQFNISGPGAVSGALLCFSIKLHDAAGKNCCSIDACIRLPECHLCHNHIQGAKYRDINGNGVRDAGEPGLAGWTIVLKDAFNNITTTTTDAFGNYWFVNLAFGTYTVSEVPQGGYAQTAPVGGTHTVTFTNPNGSVVNNRDFGNRKTGHPPDDENPDWHNPQESQARDGG